MNYNLVLHVDSDAPEILSLAFSNAANYRAALPNEDFRMVLVANGRQSSDSPVRIGNWQNRGKSSPGRGWKSCSATTR